jgi:hypothetical protein
MADNVLAKQVGKKIPQRRKTALEQLADEIEAYGGRVRDDFLSGAERSAQGLGDIVERGDVLTGIPRLALGGTGWLGAPVSAALSPMLGPILQPVGEAVNTYVGQPVEDLTGYPADITNDLAMTGLTLGAAKGLGKTGPYLTRAADEVEGLANRAGYTLRKPANVYGSGPVLTRLADDAEQGKIQAMETDADGVLTYHGTVGDAFDSVDFQHLGKLTERNSPDFEDGSFAQNLSKLGFWTSEEGPASPKLSRRYEKFLPFRIKGETETFNSLEELNGAINEFGGPEKYRQYLLKNGYGNIRVKDEEFGVTSYIALTPENAQAVKAALKPANVYGSGPVLTRIADDADDGLTRTTDNVSSANAPGPNAGEAIDATNPAFRVHPTDSQVAGSMKPGAAFSDISHKPLAAALEKGGFKVARIERSASNTETFGPSISQYFDVEAPNGNKFKVRLSDHSYVPRDGQVDLRYGMSPEQMQMELMRQSGMEVPRALSDTVAKQAADTDAARVASEQLKAQQFADEYRPKIDKALADVIAKKGEAKVLERWDLVKRQAPGARAARQALEAWGVPPDVLAALQKLR